MSTDEQFEKIAKDVWELTKKPNDEELLELYGYYKQGSVGDCNIDKPGILDPKGRAKWSSWDKHRGMSTNDAKLKYIEVATKIIAKYSN